MEVSGELHAPAALAPGEDQPGTHWIGGWVGNRASPDTVVKRKIPSPRRYSNPLIMQPVAQRHTTELSRFLPEDGSTANSWNVVYIYTLVSRQFWM
jgi:hypothetical protein